MKATILIGDVRQRLKEIPDKTVQACVTSPPYWGLRDYGHDGQLGLEATPEQYVENIVAVFREVRRILKDDGVLWLNLGDSYAGSGKGRNADGSHQEGGKQGTSRGTIEGKLSKTVVDDLKPKDLVGIPWRVAFALQADGWWLRQDIIWHKPNPMPESVTDRCTKAHEYLFMLTKNQRYYFDNDAIREPAVGKHDPNFKPRKKDWRENGWPTENDGRATKTGNPIQATNPQAPANGRNKRSVWSIPTKPFRGAHFAVMPEALVEPAILASTSQAGQCAQCGTNLIRVIEKGEISERRTRDDTLGVIPGRNRTSRLNSVEMETIPKRTVGWKKQCDCSTDETTRNLVLDPFTGSGTVAVVALRNNHNFIGTELNPEYAKIAEDRIVLAAPMFNKVEIL